MTLVGKFLWRQKKNIQKILTAPKSRSVRRDKKFEALQKKYEVLQKRYEVLQKRLEAFQWVVANSITYDEYFRNIDAALWDEVAAECSILGRYSREIQSTLPVKMATGDMKVLHFLVRKFKPKIVVETGVATGCSTLSVLRAFQKNGFGRLYSSDLPHGNWGPTILSDPVRYIGIVAQKEPNADCWDLDIRGDRVALPKIVEKLGDEKIDLFHFDSDKSYEGREFCVNTLMDKFHDEAILVFDDIADNFHFRDFVQKFDLDHVVLRNRTGMGGKGVILNFGRQMQGKRETGYSKGLSPI